MSCQAQCAACRALITKSDRASPRGAASPPLALSTFSRKGRRGKPRGIRDQPSARPTSHQAGARPNRSNATACHGRARRAARGHGKRSDSTCVRREDGRGERDVRARLRASPGGAPSRAVAGHPLGRGERATDDDRGCGSRRARTRGHRPRRAPLGHAGCTSERPRRRVCSRRSARRRGRRALSGGSTDRRADTSRSGRPPRATRRSSNTPSTPPSRTPRRWSTPSR